MAEQIKEVLDFYTSFANMQTVASICHIVPATSESKKYAERLALLQIVADDVKASDEIRSYVDGEKAIEKQYSALEISVSARCVDYISTRISPIINIKNDKGVQEDSNKLFLALAFFKVYFESKEVNAYFPLVMIAVDKQKLFTSGDLGGKIEIDYSATELVINREVIRHFYNFTYEENGTIKDEFVAEHLDALIAKDARKDVKSFIESLYSLFKSKEKETSLELVYPEINQGNSTAFMFFSAKDNYKAKREFAAMAQEDNKLVTAYLTGHFENGTAYEQPKRKYYGSLTKQYPLSAGQSDVLNLSEREKALIAVMGAPGTGKTAMILSLFANNVVKRAMNMLNGGEDYNNMILLTASANKPINNICEILSHGFPRGGFYYVGGRVANKDLSAKGVDEYIKALEAQSFSAEKLANAEAEMRQCVSIIDSQDRAFEKFFTDKKVLAVKSYDELLTVKEELQGFVSRFDEATKTTHSMDSLLKKIEIFTSKQFSFDELEGRLNNGFLEELEVIKFKLDSLGFMSKIFGAQKRTLAGLNLNIADKIAFQGFLDVIKLIQESTLEYKAAVEVLSKKARLVLIEKYLASYATCPQSFNNMVSSPSWDEYFRLYLYKENYDLYIASLRYMEQKVLQDKTNVIRALKYLGSEGGYDYLVDNYGKDARRYGEVLKYISMVYPVFTSTLASVGSLFPGFYPNKISIFRTVIADEAGMVTAMDLLPALRRAKRAIVIGDPKQLAPVLGIDDIFIEALSANYEKSFWDKYSPSSVSAFNRAAGAEKGGYEYNGRCVVLDEHRRCAKEIAELFIKIAGYKGIKICSHVPAPKTKHRLMMFDVKTADPNGFRKINEREIAFVGALLDKLARAGYNLQTDVGIITPYQDQEAALIARYGDRLNHKLNSAKIGTVHKFQGVEFKIIIFSTVVSRDTDSLDFINNDPSLVNVAISRAQESFLVVGDYDKLTSKNNDKNFVGIMAREIKAQGFYAKA